MAVVDSERHQNDLVNELIASVEAYNPGVDRELIRRAFAEAERAHRGQVRRSGEPFINHPLGVALICAQLRLDEQTIAAALLHDVVEDTEADLEELRGAFGDEIAQLVDGVTKLTRISFQSREQAEAENYRKMIVAMAQDVRVILIKLADRLHNMRTIEYLGKQKQMQKARETLEIYAPLAHRLGIHASSGSSRTSRSRRSTRASTPRSRRWSPSGAPTARATSRGRGAVLQGELEKADIQADISGRAKHFYSIYEKMTKKGREFNEIYDLTAMRVLVERGGERTRDCYGALGVIHSLWKPMPGRFKDFIAMPKFNRYRSLHTTVIGPKGRPLEIQVRTREMHETAEYGVAAHWVYKRGRADEGRRRVGHVGEDADGLAGDEPGPAEFMETLRTDLFDDEVYVFTPKGEVKSLPAGATPLDFAYAVHTDVGHRTVGAKVNGKIVPLHYQLKYGDIVEILTSKSERGPSRDWMSVAESSRARNKIRQWFPRETRARREANGREALEQALKQQNLPYRKLAGSAVLAQVIREIGSRRPTTSTSRSAPASSPGQVVNKVIQRLKTDEVGRGARDHAEAPKARDDGGGRDLRHQRRGRRRCAVRLAKCCTPGAGRPDRRLHLARQRDHDPPRRLPERQALRRNPERFTPVEWEGERDAELPRGDRGRRVGPPPPARGRRADVRRARREHRRLRRHGRGRDGEELVHGRAR